MDSGKSTLIKSLLRKNTGRLIEPDALCIEQATGRTITGTRIACPVNDHTDLVFCDCPGHLEYLPEIVSGLCASRGYILIIDEKRREQSEAYQRKLGEIAAAIGIENIAVVHSHSLAGGMDEIHYDTEQPSFDAAMERLLETMNRFLRKKHMAPADESRVVWFDSLDGAARYVLYDAAGHVVDWAHEGSHDPGDCSSVSELPPSVSGRFLVCRAKKGNIVGVGTAA